jgi:nucleoside-diphosphate-sugar epimerase
LKVLVTGGRGFVGSALVARLSASMPDRVRISTRGAGLDPPAGVQVCHVGELSPATDWSSALRDVDTVVHLAARVHIMREAGGDALDRYRQSNTAGTIAFARQAVATGVQRFVFVSSLKVHGESGSFSESVAPAPQDPYAISKHEAELGLHEVTSHTQMQVVVIRPPLVYGPGVGANFGALIRCIRSGIPLPLGAVRNRRSFVSLPNLVDFLCTCIVHPAAANETFLVSDDDDMSTADLIRRLARAMDRPARLVPLPIRFIRFLTAIAGKRAQADRLMNSLFVDISHAKRRLGWSPPVGVDEALRLTVSPSRNLVGE